MRQSIVDVPGEQRIFLLKENARAIAPCSAESPFAQAQTRHLSRCGRAVLLITASFVVATWASEARASSEARQARRLLFASSLTESAPHGNATNTSKRVAQGAPSDAGAMRQAFDQEHRRADMLERELESAKHDLESIKGRDEAAQEKSAAESSAAELRKSLLRERAERLDRDLSGVRRDGDPRMLPAAKAGEEAKEPKQAADIGAAELRKSLQQERERATRLEQDLAAARRALETQTALAAKAKDEAGRQKQAAEGSAAELKQSLRQEHDRADALADQLSTTRAQVDAYKAQARKATEQAEELKKVAADSGAVELQKSLQRERERAYQLEQNLASARRELETQAALAAKAKEEESQQKQAAEGSAAELRQSLRQEHERADVLANQLSTARASLYAYDAQARKATEQAEELKKAPANSGAAELRKSLQQERERASQLERNLAFARKDVDTQTALVATTKEEENRLKQAAEGSAVELRQSLRQEHERADALANQLSTARASLYAYDAQARKATEQAEELKKAAANSGAAELRKSLQQERERASQLEQDLASARKDVDTQAELVAKANDEAVRLKKAAESGATELKSSQQEHDRAEGLAKELATARAKIDEHEARERNASYQLQDLKKAAGTDAAEQRKSLQQERARAEQLEQDLASERSKKLAPLAAVVATAGPITGAPEADTTQAATANQTKPARAGGEALAHAEETVRLVARASVLLGQGDIGSARIVLERAAETGSAQANFALAETYDPIILAKWGTFGTRGDTRKARELYARAEADGNKEAKQRLDALQ